MQNINGQSFEITCLDIQELERRVEMTEDFPVIDPAVDRLGPISWK
jgi:hypothetical protein